MLSQDSAIFKLFLIERLYELGKFNFNKEVNLHRSYLDSGPKMPGNGPSLDIT